MDNPQETKLHLKAKVGSSETIRSAPIIVSYQANKLGEDIVQL